jgi:integrase
MNIVFKSVFSGELTSFMEFAGLSVSDLRHYQTTLCALDSFLCKEGLTEKRLDADRVSRWLDGFTHIKDSTKQGKLTCVRRFSAYLRTLDIETTLPEFKSVASDFMPYVFSEDEMTQIFEVVDDLSITRPKSRITAEFPMLLRLLYGCGLRLGEAVMLSWDDIDLHDGIITIKFAKNNKQRRIPMSGELTRTLALYRNAPCFGMEEHGFLFGRDGCKHRSNRSYWSLFDSILCELGIKNRQTMRHGSRGPCIHSLRHTFTMHSFLKAEAAGYEFMEVVPFLSTYLGHSGLMETDKYLRAHYRLYEKAHATIADYTRDVFPEAESDG